MNTLAKTPTQGLAHFTPQQLNLIQRTTARDCNPAEFDEFMHVCNRTNLDPLRRQIYAVIYNKNNAQKRQMVIIIGIDGYRAIADRSGNYRPADKSTEFVCKDDLKGPTNPLGIESATVTLYKFSHGDWFPVVATAYWDEYAPITTPDNQFDWIETGDTWPDTGKPKKTKVPKEGAVAVLDTSSKWPKMPRQMIEKCATAKAHRAGWPDDFSGTYDEAELDQMKTVELSASEWAEHAATEDRLVKIGGKNAIMFDFPNDDLGLRMVPIGELPDKVFEFLKENPDQVEYLEDRNRVPLQEFWALNKSDALEVKKAIETAKAKSSE
ncbi:MAG: phage recombination protein Bet [Gammaproteobacteria bacterium]|nr:phage recombination protein Bet [Gammaproteobacteria bacterium]